MISSRLAKITATAAALVALAANVHAYTASFVWDPAHNPSTTYKWSEGDNWHQFIYAGGDAYGTAPADVNAKAVFAVNPAATCIVDVALSPGQVVMGDGGPGSLVIANGGSLAPAATDWFGVGYDSPAYLEVQTGGTLNCPDHLWVGFLAAANGTLVLSGGTATVNGQLGMGFEGGTAHAYINGGTLNLHNFIAGPGANHVTINDTSTMDITGGKVIINGDQTTAVNAYIAAGRITAYGGSGSVSVDYNIINPGQTTVSAPGGGGGGSAAHINSITVAGGNVTIKYTTSSGPNYHVETSGGVSPASWSTVGGTTTAGTGGEVTATFAAGGGAAFYRVSTP